MKERGVGGYFPVRFEDVLDPGKLGPLRKPDDVAALQAVTERDAHADAGKDGVPDPPGDPVRERAVDGKVEDDFRELAEKALEFDDDVELLE